MICDGRVSHCSISFDWVRTCFLSGPETDRPGERPRNFIRLFSGVGTREHRGACRWGAAMGLAPECYPMHPRDTRGVTVGWGGADSIGAERSQEEERREWEVRPLQHAHGLIMMSGNPKSKANTPQSHPPWVSSLASFLLFGSSSCCKIGHLINYRPGRSDLAWTQCGAACW